MLLRTVLVHRAADRTVVLGGRLSDRGSIRSADRPGGIMQDAPSLVANDPSALLEQLGAETTSAGGDALEVTTPITGEPIASIHQTTEAEASVAVERSLRAFEAWREVPAPHRGELVRLLGEELRREKETLGALVTLEAGKIVQEGLGEVQEMIDICDFAVGLSRQLYGLTIASERPGHRMMESWHPLGPVGVITAFNFPVAVWSWNSALALVCGDPVLWKPSSQTPLTALACQTLLQRAAERHGEVPDGLLEVLIGSAGRALVDDPRVPLVSATGSTAMGRALAPKVAGRLGRSLLELGGNNAMIVAPTADLDLAVRAIVFAAVGTCGQRCTSLRRLIVHNDVADELLDRLERAYASVQVGDPRESGTLCGPLINGDAFQAMQAALDRARGDGATVAGGERVLEERWPDAHYVRPAVVRMPGQTEVVREETFAPVLYAMRYQELDEAIALHNDVPQGLSSCIFTADLRESERFLAVAGSDCGIANVNIGPSGAEIGGAFGGEKETGGGRESGSDAWKAYMRRQTATVNYSRDLPLAQGIVFDVG
jgi:aldehyde dehydrogenase (NAD+)